MFGINTGEPLPPELMNLEPWDRFIGRIWHSLLRLVHFDPGMTVAEIAPGNSMKIGNALALSEFHLKLYIIDASAKVLDLLLPKYKEILPQADIIPVCSSVEDCTRLMPQDIHFVLGNHVIDDMLLYHDKAPEVLAWAEAYTRVPADILKTTWQAMEKNTVKLAQAKRDARDTFLKLFENWNCGAILNQYPSGILLTHGMNSLNEEAFNVLEEIKREAPHSIVDPARVQDVLATHINYGNKHIGEDLLNSKNWMLLCPRKAN